MKFRYALLAALLASAAYAQDILTADQFFRSVSETYAGIKDYEAAITVRTSKQSMSGTVSYLAPSLMRVDFTQPAGQVIVYNGETMVVYVPELRVVLNQQTSATSGSAAATGNGLRMLGSNYKISFLVGPEPVPLSETESESVIKLLLTRNSVAEGFRTITLSINPKTLLIRRLEGVTMTGETLSYDFSNIRLNQGIPAARFLYDTPPSANVYNNFLFSSDN
ncbi:MAG TPA: outer membrane lipoprotein carrier protein LolA [Spirochaetales bacterium]|nr:outer membrane lipoprotein carrier protein LolA [Spirochaetales bacterium]MBP7263141.1 outer membrane lipoprotein carrier protein LolA [Spirochaetia bacterium]HPE36528.1 outer membrane lipoprotein carrier protein LolA [Spirochaetales bacterium]